MSRRERRARALLAMCIARPELGERFLSRLTAEHLPDTFPPGLLEWLVDHLEAPLQGLEDAEPQLQGAVRALAMAAERDPVEAEAMELNLIELEVQRVEDRLAAAAERGAEQERVALERERIQLREQLIRPGAG